MDNPYFPELCRFYELLEVLRDGLGGGRVLGECTGRMLWPRRGVYFFFEPGEMRSGRRKGNRVVRVGTHAVSDGSKTTLWTRLRTHRGAEDGSGNHRGSIFRLRVGEAMIARDKMRGKYPAWGIGSSGTQRDRDNEGPLEKGVSAYIGGMSILWLAVLDEPSPSSLRAFIEQDSIALLYSVDSTLDHPSGNWLGRFSLKKKIRNSGLWNVNHLNTEHGADFLRVFEKQVHITIRRFPP